MKILVNRHDLHGFRAIAFWALLVSKVSLLLLSTSECFDLFAGFLVARGFLLRLLFESFALSTEFLILRRRRRLLFEKGLVRVRMGLIPRRNLVPAGFWIGFG